MRVMNCTMLVAAALACGCSGIDKEDHAGVAALVTDEDVGKDTVVYGKITGRHRAMIDATFWEEFWALKNGIRLQFQRPEPEFLKPGVLVRIRGQLIVVPGQMAVETPKWNPPYYSFQVIEIESSDHADDRNTLFRLAGPPAARSPQSSPVTGI